MRLAGGLAAHIAEHGLDNVAGRDHVAALQQPHRARLEVVEIHALAGAQDQLGQALAIGPVRLELLGQIATEGVIEAVGNALAALLQALGSLLGDEERDLVAVLVADELQQPVADALQDGIVGPLLAGQARQEGVVEVLEADLGPRHAQAVLLEDHVQIALGAGLLDLRLDLRHVGQPREAFRQPDARLLDGSAQGGGIHRLLVGPPALGLQQATQVLRGHVAAPQAFWQIAGF